MKRACAALLGSLLSFAASAQDVVHGYCWLNTMEEADVYVTPAFVFRHGSPHAEGALIAGHEDLRNTFKEFASGAGYDEVDAYCDVAESHEALRETYASRHEGEVVDRVKLARWMPPGLPVLVTTPWREDDADAGSSP